VETTTRRAHITPNGQQQSRPIRAQNATYHTWSEECSEGETDDDDANCGERLVISWNNINHNPWGRDEYTEDDAVLFSTTAGGIGDVDVLFPGIRFEIDPFSRSDRYHSTHHTPEEGFQALVLTRDPLETIPWGFTVYRHEFGGACLVSSVFPLSPAGAAVSCVRNHSKINKNHNRTTHSHSPIGLPWSVPYQQCVTTGQ
jgi:hypothetical protein